ncbi:phage tail tube protein [Actinotignum schaalii]|uniref:phage tail tube protein n=1 Tax=Actinotignum TaxID=1653174 RepID=UPI00237E1AEB|nr:hypothetical protein [Actinotignum sanguinis]MDE1552219.1 hypothetical protein [Actinotignum sanguinis]
MGKGFKTIADQHILLMVLQTKPKDPRHITVAELTAGKKVSCHILKSDYQLGATSQATVSETEICNPGEGNAPGAISYEGTITIPRYLDENGLPDAEADFAYELFRTPGTTLYLVEREGPLESAAVAQGQEYDCYEVVTMAPRKPSDRFSGYQKRTVPLSIAAAYEGCKVAAAA